MSIAALNWAWKQNDLKSQTKFVLVALADYADKDTFDCFPKAKTLAKKCNLHVETVRNHLRILKGNNFIEVVAQYVNNRQTSNLYLFHHVRDQGEGYG